MRNKEIGIPEVVRAPRTDPVYNCHAYLTKVPVAAILPFIREFTSPGDVVLDLFAGSGMTGIASAILGRKAELSDISRLGQHIATGYMTEVAPGRYREAAAHAVEEARNAIGDFYLTRRATDGATTEMVRTVWSFVYSCPECSAEMVYFRHLRSGGTKQPDCCPACSAKFVRRSWPHVGDVPVHVVVRGPDGRLVDQDICEIDEEAVRTAEADDRQKEIPSREIEADREMYRRSGLGKHGMTETRLFFSPRNSIALLELWKAIQKLEDAQLRSKLLFAFTAVLPRASRRYQWGPKRPLNAQNQTYYIAPVYFEWNVFELFLRKVEAAVRSDGEIFRSMPLLRPNLASNVNYSIASADHLEHLDDDSVDYVFTDPPFGSNIFYADMNLFHEAWLGDVTDHTKEAVVHTCGKRKAGAAERYEQLLTDAFTEAYRVLRPGRFMSVVFGNSSGTLWGLVLRTLRESGFASPPVHVAILDKGQRSVKGLNSGSEGVVTVDLVLTVRKPEIGQEAALCQQEAAEADAQELLAVALRKLPSDKARNPSYVYVACIREAIGRGQLVDNLHLGDALIALRRAGYSIDSKSGLIQKPPAKEVASL